jgi:hypothetical protein
MNLAEKTLKTLHSKEIFVNIFTDFYDESLLGFIKNFNHTFLVLEHYNDDGFYDGIVTLRIQDITRIRWDNNDINSVFKLIVRHEPTKGLDDIHIGSMVNIIRSVDRIFNYVNLRIQNIETNWSIIGQVQEIDDETVVIKEFGTMSTLDRAMLMLSISDITRIDVDGIYENNLMKIHQPIIR